jgi:hypothetical protein
MAVHQTPFNYSWYGHSKDFHLRSLRSTIIYCSVAAIPLSGTYSCAYASFSLDSAGTESLAGGATLHDHAIACVNG